MDLKRIVAAGLFAVSVSGLAACRSDSVSSPGDRRAAWSTSADRQSELSHTLIVDDDRLQCRDADFTSIQAAVDAAIPPATILVCAGTYYEWVLITKDDLRLLAKGQPGDVMLDGQNIPAPLPCSPTNLLAVRCAGFELRGADGNLIEGFLVRRYWEAGIWLRERSSGNTIRKNLTTESPHHDGIQVANALNNIIEHNTSFRNFAPALNACGINVAAGSAGNVVRHNESFENDFGIQVAGGSANNVILHNESHDNRRFGIRNVVGSNGTLIENNRVLDHPGPGIFITQSSGVTVARNKAFDNVPDLSWDGFGANEFLNNHCRTSVPPGLCEHMEGESK